MKTLQKFPAIILTSFISILILLACEKEKVSDDNSDILPPVISAATVSTYSGSSKGYVDGPSDKAKFLAPSKIVVASDGALYIADFNKIRKIDQNGIVSTFAGCHETDLAVDGTGLDAGFANIASMTISKDGTLYVAEVENVPSPISGSFVVARKITSERVVTTAYYEKTGLYLYDITSPGPLECSPDTRLRLYQVDNYAASPYRANGSTLLNLSWSRVEYIDILSMTDFNYRIKSLAVGRDGAMYILNEHNELFKRKYDKIWQVTPAGSFTSSAMDMNVSALPDNSQEDEFSPALDYLEIGNDGTIYITNGVKIWTIGTGGKMNLLAGGEPGYADGPALDAKFEKISSIALAENDSVLYVIDKFKIRRIDL